MAKDKFEVKLDPKFVEKIAKALSGFDDDTLSALVMLIDLRVQLALSNQHAPGFDETMAEIHRIQNSIRLN
jgi:hypothetical protein